jgi:hypothetical protein
VQSNGRVDASKLHDLNTLLSDGPTTSGVLGDLRWQFEDMSEHVFVEYLHEGAIAVG